MNVKLERLAADLRALSAAVRTFDGQRAALTHGKNRRAAGAALYSGLVVVGRHRSDGARRAARRRFARAPHARAALAASA